MADGSAQEEKSVLLDVKDLKTHFFQRQGVLKAVDGVSFTVREGEAVGLVGESGSGKTMTCLSLMQLVPRPGVPIVGGPDLVPRPESAGAFRVGNARVPGPPDGHDHAGPANFP